MSKGSRPRTYGKQYEQNFEEIFKKQSGLAWAKELGLRFAPVAWEGDSFSKTEISKSKFYELYNQSL